MILNHNPEGEPWQVGDFQTLERLKLAVHYKQKAFIAHPSVQQLLASIWYEGLPGFRRKNIFGQVFDVLKLACTFPINSMIYIMAPHSEGGKFMRNPFVKFISHSASYLFFLFLLALASQRIEHVIISLICFLFPGTEWLAEIQRNWIKYERGSLPHFVELLIVLWVQGFLWTELKTLWKDGLLGYLQDLWNLADLFSLGSFMAWIGLRVLAWLIVQKEQWDGVDPDLIWTPKEEWHMFEPQLLAEAMFGAGMISSYLKVVHILSINPYLGPLQIALGKMVIDIVKWLFLYLLVVFAFGCGMNQLLWYYSDLERQQCYSLPGGLPDFDNEPESCVSWRRFANLWETSQSLFWASFGLVDLGDFELKGIKEFTRFWGLLMFGSYSVCNIIVLLNMLIAMMSNSYQIIFEKSDMEWKFSRSKLWISYFEPGSTVPVPFNLIPSPKSMMRILCCRKIGQKVYTEDDILQANDRYYNVMKFVIRRYITSEQRKSEDYSITEDDIQEVRQDINSFKYELLDILRDNNMNVPNTKRGNGVVGRKSKNMERQIQKGFNITHVEGVMEAFFTASQEEKPKDVFKRFAKIITDKDRQKRREAEGQRRSSMRKDPIGSTQTSIKRHRSSLKRSLLQRGNSQQEIKMVLTRLNSEELVAFNPHLSEHAPTTRRAYAKFKTALDRYNEQHAKGELPTNTAVVKPEKKERTNRDSIRKLVIEKSKSIDSQQSLVNKAAIDLERLIDKDGNEPGTEDPKATVSGEHGEVNQGFVGDELEVRLIPPSHQGSISDSPSPSMNVSGRSTPSQMQKSSASSSRPSAAPSPKPTPKSSIPPSPQSTAAPTPKPSAPPSPKLSAGPTPKPSAAPTPKPSALSSPKPSAASTSTPSAPPTPKPPAPPSPKQSAVPSTKASPKPSPKALAGPAAEKAKEPPPEGKFDPEGKSAVSGQKRTGWI